MLGEVVLNDALFGGLMALTTGVILGLFGWVLTQVVALGRLMAKLDAQADDHERRILDLEGRG